MEKDYINLEMVNNLPQPLAVRLYGSDMGIMVENIEVGTGITRLDVHGKIDIVDYSDIKVFIDADYNQHDPDKFVVNNQL